MAFNAYLVFHSSSNIRGESSSVPEDAAKDQGAIEVSDYGFGVNMNVTSSRSDGGGATVGRANFDVFTCNKAIDTSTCDLVKHCCTGKNVQSIVLHLYRAGDDSSSGVIKYAMVVFQNCVITKCGVSGGGDELPKESLEFNYGFCEYWYQKTNHSTGKWEGNAQKYGWSTVTNRNISSGQVFTAFAPSGAAEK